MLRVQAKLCRQIMNFILSGILTALTWAGMMYAVSAIFFIRPFAGWVSLTGVSKSMLERGVISFFGIRGVGTAYYLAYGLNQAKFDDPDLLWSVASVIILMSILIHGTTVPPVMHWLDRGAGRAGSA